MTIREDIVRGMQTIFWGDAWASHTEEHDCCNLSGCQVEDYMPQPIPHCVVAHAQSVLEDIEAASKSSIESLYLDALCANEAANINTLLKHESSNRHSAERFGECLAWMSMGAGVSWCDDNARVPTLKVPYSEAGELRIHADTACEEESRSGRIACSYCGQYNDPKRRDKCENCRRDIEKQEEEHT